MRETIRMFRGADNKAVRRERKATITENFVMEQKFKDCDIKS